MTHEDLESARRGALIGEMLQGAAIAGSQRELLDGITGILARALDADLAGAFEFLPDAEKAVLQAGVGWDRRLISKAEVPAATGSTVSRMLEADRTLLLGGDLEPPSPASELLAGQKCTSACARRLEGPGGPFGYLVVASLTAREFDNSDIETVEAAAAAISLALARLRAERRLAGQRGLVQVVAAASSLDQASSQILEQIATGIGWQVATLWRVEESSGRIRCVDAWGASRRYRKFVIASLEMEHSYGEGLPGAAWASGEPRWISSVPDAPKFRRARAGRATGLRTGLIFPILVRDRVAGAFEIFTSGIEQLDEALTADLAGFGAAIGQLLERESIQVELQRATAELARVLQNLGTGVAAVNADGSLRFANDAAAQALGLETTEELFAAGPDELRSRLRVLDEHGSELAAQRRLISRALKGEEVPPTVVRALTPGRPERWFQVRATPLIARSGQPRSALVTFDEVTQLKLNEKSLRESEEAHRRIGEVLQLGLLAPELPEITDVDLAVRFRAVGDRALVGGDFYDAFPLPGNRWMLVVGDISGKGIEAAAFTALVRYTIRAAAVRDQDPAAALAQVNEMLIRDPGVTRLCTAVSALLETDPRRVTIARGGHTPPLLLGAQRDGPVRIQPRGEMLGAYEDSAYENQSFSLDGGDTLVMYTDGISDAGVRSDGGAIEIEGVERHLCASRAGDAASIAAAIDAAAAAADRGTQTDDALVVVAKVR